MASNPQQLPTDPYLPASYQQGLDKINAFYANALTKPQTGLRGFAQDHPVWTTLIGTALGQPLAAPLINMGTQRYNAATAKNWADSVTGYNARYKDKEAFRTGFAETQAMNNLFKNAGIDPKSILPSQDVILSNEMKDRLMNGIQAQGPESYLGPLNQAALQGFNTAMNSISAGVAKQGGKLFGQQGGQALGSLVQMMSGGQFRKPQMESYDSKPMSLTAGILEQGSPPLSPAIYQSPTIYNKVLDQLGSTYNSAMNNADNLLQTPSNIAYKQALTAGQNIENKLLPALTQAKINNLNRPPAGPHVNPYEGALAQSMLQARQQDYEAGQQKMQADRLGYLKNLLDSAGVYNRKTKQYDTPSEQGALQRYNAVMGLLQAEQDRATGGQVSREQSALRARHQKLLQGW